jgi:hypothetical protein
MLPCPQCAKPLAELTRSCPSCRADLDLLVEYVNHLEEGLRRAEKLTRAGELDAAVWEYLNVLEVDPDNAAARRQVSRVATAVRVFDRISPGRTPERWDSLARGERGDERGRPSRWLWALLVLLLLGLAFGLGYALGSQSEGQPPGRKDPPRLPQPDRSNQLGR